MGAIDDIMFGHYSMIPALLMFGSFIGYCLIVKHIKRKEQNVNKAHRVW